MWFMLNAVAQRERHRVETCFVVCLKLVSSCFVLSLKRIDQVIGKSLSTSAFFKSSSTFNIHILWVLRHVWNEHRNNGYVAIPVLDAWLMSRWLVEACTKMCHSFQDKSRHEICWLNLITKANKINFLSDTIFGGKK